tara:strand:- start:151 stop:711 length:561 start_codon:yes stop_codon:yes gene_type:complete
MEDLDLINKIKSTGDEKSLKKLIEKHSGIYVDMVNKYIPKSMEGVHKEDILQDKNFSIYSAAIKYDESKKSKFSTYLGNLTKWKCLNIYNKSIKFPQNSLDESTKIITFSNNDESFDRIQTQEDINNVFKFIEESKDERVKVIFKMRYADKKKLTPWKKIAKKLDLSIQGCINIHNNFLNKIKKYV